MPTHESSPVAVGEPPVSAGTATVDLASSSGDALLAWVETILPHWRCITGEGLRATLLAIGEQVPISIIEVPTGTPVLDWTIPPEWAVREAYIARSDGTRVVDVAASPLHIVQYSMPVRERMTFSQLRPHLHTLPEHSDWIPYRTDYYTNGWGFCLRQTTLNELATSLDPAEELEVVIDADLFEGSLSYGEVVISGVTESEILISAHACHPALANDNASSLAVATALARQLAEGPPLRHTIRFVFAPGTIGSIAWLAQNRQRVGRIQHGLVLANLGDGGGFTYKQTRRGTLDVPLVVDQVVPRVLQEADMAVEVRPFEPFGYDERQYGSPGFDLPVGRLTRTPHAEYPEYHTSADDLSLLRPNALAESLQMLHRIVRALDGEVASGNAGDVARTSPQPYRSLAPYAEPQLGRRGLYRYPDGTPHPPELQAALSWILSLGDGRRTLSDVAGHSGIPDPVVHAAADRLVEAGLIQIES